MYHKIFVNQCGYLPNMVKKVTFVSPEPVTFQVCRSDGTVVFQGKTEKQVENASAGEVNQIGVFSSVTEAGRYYIKAAGMGESTTFPINEAVYEDLYQKGMEFFYLQRCGCNLKPEAGIFAHSSCHTTEAVVYGSDQKREVNGGWHDAGDYGRYVVPGAMAVAQLLLGYEKNPVFAETYPNYLEEVKYELDWMLKMQREDGQLYHKVGCYQFCGFILPQEEKEELVLSPVSVTATADFAAVTAMAVAFYVKENPAYAQKLTEASKKAYEALQQMDMPGGFHNPPEIVTGEYGDACDEDERYWAAAELYKAFGEEKYRQDFETMAEAKIYHGYGWEEMGSYGNRAYLSCDRDVNKELKAKIEQAVIQKGEQLLAKIKQDGYGTALDQEEYRWGSNLLVANRGLQLMDAYRLTGEAEFFQGAREQLHYLLGRNPMGLCYVTGCGTVAIRWPHHRPSGYLGQTMPGMLSGGPCNWLADELAKELLTEAPAAKCLVDMTGSYSTNEVTIYWNSALIQLLLEIMQ